MKRIGLHKILFSLKEDTVVSFAHGILNSSNKTVSCKDYKYYCYCFESFISYWLCRIMLNNDNADIVEQCKGKVITLLRALGCLYVKKDDVFLLSRQKCFRCGFIRWSYGEYFEDDPTNSLSTSLWYARKGMMLLTADYNPTERDKSRDGEYLQRIKELYFRLIPIIGIADEQYRNERINNAIDQFIS